MSDNVLVSHNAIFNICSHIHSAIHCKVLELEAAEKFEAKDALHRIIARSLYIRNEIETLNSLFYQILDIAPDDIKDFFIHYEEITNISPI